MPRCHLLPLFTAMASLAGAAGNHDWPVYLADNASSQYTALDQVTKDNVSRLQVAWTFDASKYGAANRTLLECNPLVIDGILYGTTASKILFALDAAMGEELWHFDPYAIIFGEEAASANRGWPNRGVTYWTDGNESSLFYAAENLLFALNPATGKLIPSFGDNGSIDLRQGLGRDVGNLAYAPTSPGIIFEDLIIIGARMVESLPSAPGHIRAFDVRSGRQVWRFNTIPHPGELGHDTWPEDAYLRAGGANVWTGMALDVECGLVYCPTGSASFDYYAGDRIGQNLFANTLVCLDARTGERVWHYQIVHHDIFDMDLPSPPTLFTARKEGREIPAVALLTKQGFLFVFNRLTGESLFPIVDVPAPPSTVPGEQAWPTQPRPLKPEPYSRLVFSRDQITDISPESTREVTARFNDLEPHQPFLPLSAERPTIVYPGVWGGASWGGAAVDPHGILYFNTHDMPAILTLLDTSQGQSTGEGLYRRNCMMCHGVDLKGTLAFGQQATDLVGITERMTRADFVRIVREGKGTMPPSRHLHGIEVGQLFNYLQAPGEKGAVDSASTEPVQEPVMRYSHTGNIGFTDSKGYPAIKPPWGSLSAVDLNTGEYRWQVVFGEFPALMEQGLPPTGRMSFGGPVATASGVLFIAANLDGYLRAYDTVTGKELWRDKLPAGGYATPSIYAVDGKQYIVIACGGGRGTPEADLYVAYTLP